eukprot:6473923-Alexandrium_andersonii.AAC.1
MFHESRPWPRQHLHSALPHRWAVLAATRRWRTSTARGASSIACGPWTASSWATGPSGCAVGSCLSVSFGRCDNLDVAFTFDYIDSLLALVRNENCTVRNVARINLTQSFGRFDNLG